MQSTMHVYEVRTRKDHRGVDLISDAEQVGKGAAFLGVGRTMAGGSVEESTGAPRPNPLLVRSAKRAKPQQHRWRKAPGIEVMSLTA